MPPYWIDQYGQPQYHPQPPNYDHYHGQMPGFSLPQQIPMGDSLRVNVPAPLSQPPQPPQHYPEHYPQYPDQQYFQQHQHQLQQHQHQHQHQQPLPFQYPNQYSQVQNFQQYNQNQFVANQHQAQTYQPPPPPQVVIPPRSTPTNPVPTQQTFHQSPPMQQRPVKDEVRSRQRQQLPPPPAAVPTKPQTPRVLQDVQHVNRQPVQKPPPAAVKPVEEPEPNCPSLLLSLADEYLEASSKFSERNEDYYKLVATALGCIESTLKNFQLAPLREAQLSLKYAQLLYDETLNYDEAETILTKAQDICESMKFLDLKYAVQLLLVKVMYESKPRAAIRDLQNIISDVETYRHTVFEYAFRFEYVFLTTRGSLNMHEAIIQLERIQHVSKQHGDHAIYAFAALMEALLHLRGIGEDAVKSSQLALSKARALVLNPDVGQHPQMPLMMEMIELYSCTKAAQHEQIDDKRKILQDVLYPAIEKPDWRADGLVMVPFSARTLQNIQIQEGGLVHESKGKHFLAFSWVGKDEIEAIGFLLSGDSIIHKNFVSGKRAEKYMISGFEIPKEVLEKDRSCAHKVSLLQDRLRLLSIHFILQAAILKCGRGQYLLTQSDMAAVENISKELTKTMPIALRAMQEYLRGVIAQATGNSKEALQIYQSPILNVNQWTENAASSNAKRIEIDLTHRHISLLAGMSSALILHSPTHPQHSQLQPLINSLDPLLKTTKLNSLESAYSFLLAVLPNSTILRTKQYLSNALNIAKRLNDNQLIGLTLTVMQEKFFKGVVPDTQAVKCARAATQWVKNKWGDSMWLGVATGLEAECLEMRGEDAVAAEKRLDAQKAWNSVPEGVRRLAQTQN